MLTFIESTRDLMSEAKKKFELTHEGAVEDLYRFRDDAWVQETLRRRLTHRIYLLKVGGLIVDRREVLHGKVDQMSRGEVERRLADLLGKQAIEHKSGIEIVDKSGFEEVGVIVGEEIVGDKKKEKKKRQVRPVPKEKEENED
jgi:hypothetical protein